MILTKVADIEMTTRSRLKIILVGDELEGIEVAQMMDEKDQGLYGAANKHYGSLGTHT